MTTWKSSGTRQSWHNGGTCPAPAWTNCVKLLQKKLQYSQHCDLDSRVLASDAASLVE